MRKKSKSTYEKFIEDPEQKALLEKECRALVVSELLIAIMKDAHLSVRKLALAAGISPTIVQAIRSGKKPNITLGTLSKILDAVGYQLVVAPKGQVLPLH